MLDDTPIHSSDEKRDIILLLNAALAANVAIAHGIRSNHIYTTQMIQDNDTKRSSRIASGKNRSLHSQSVEIQ